MLNTRIYVQLNNGTRKIYTSASVTSDHTTKCAGKSDMIERNDTNDAKRNATSARGCSTAVIPFIVGFYRVNYNSKGWRRIFDVLHSDKYYDIHVLNRAALVDDLLNLGRTGYQKYDTVLDGITYLKRERNYLPFKAALNGLSYLDKRFRGYKEYSLFKVG